MAELVKPVGISDYSAEDTLVVAEEYKGHLACYCDCDAQSAPAAEEIGPHLDGTTRMLCSVRGIITWLSQSSRVYVVLESKERTVTAHANVCKPTMIQGMSYWFSNDIRRNLE